MGAPGVAFVPPASLSGSGLLNLLSPIGRHGPHPGARPRAGGLGKLPPPRHARVVRRASFPVVTPSHYFAGGRWVTRRAAPRPFFRPRTRRPAGGRAL